jgi:ribosomal protein S12 methylthiotransferase accessory factor
MRRGNRGTVGRSSATDAVSVPASASLLVIGAQFEAAMKPFFWRAFSARARFITSLPPPPVNESLAHLVLWVTADPDSNTRRTFDVWVQGAGIPGLGVELRENQAVIGPLALPQRAGCGQCAGQRTIAARAADRDSRPSAVTRNARPAARAWRVLINEVRAIVRRGAECSRLLDHILVVDFDKGDTSLHRVIPLPRCAVCGGAEAFPLTSQQRFEPSAEDSPETVLSALAGWVDWRTGIISRLVVEHPRDTGVDLPAVATAGPPHVAEADGSIRRLPIGWGKGLTVSGAILSAIGEAIERYGPSLPNYARIIWERPNDLRGDFVDPQRFALYTDAQYTQAGFPYARFDPNVRHPWVQGWWSDTGSAVWVHAVFAFLSLTLQREHLICQGTSNGLAAFTNTEEAALRATLELVERDAMMAAWLSTCPGRRVELDDSLDANLHRVVAGIEALGGKVELYVLPTSACGTTALCLAFGDGKQYPGVTIGLGADLDPRSAIRQAIFELGQTGPHLRRLMRSNTLPVPANPEEVRDMLQHAAYYFPMERANAFDRLRSTEAPIPLGDLAKSAAPRSLRSCTSALGAVGVRVALVDVTSADLATGPFRVVRAVSPDLQSISYGYGFDRKPVERTRARGLASAVPPIHPIW